VELSSLIMLGQLVREHGDLRSLTGNCQPTV